MITTLTWMDIYIYMKTNHAESYTPSYIHQEVSKEMSWTSVLDGINKLEKMGLINSEKAGRERIIYKTQLFFDVEDIFREIETISRRGIVQ